MKLTTFIVLIIISLGAGLGVSYAVFGKTPLKERAAAAYQAKDYPKAYALYKEYAQSSAVRANRAEHDRIIMLMVEIDGKMNPPAAPAPLSASQPAAAAADPQAAVVADDPPTGADRIPHKKPAAGGILAMSIKQLGNFEFDPVVDADVPADVKLLEGAHIKITGFMIPLTQAVKVDKFALVPTLAGCCFGAPPGVQHVVTCITPQDRATDYVLDEIEVEGIIHIRVQREDNYTSSIFELDVTAARIKE
jgi:hypothetical protein